MLNPARLVGAALAGVVLLGSCDSSREVPDGQGQIVPPIESTDVAVVDPTGDADRKSPRIRNTSPSPLAPDTPSSIETTDLGADSSVAVPKDHLDPEEAWNVTYDVHGEVSSRAWSLEVPDQMTMSWHPNDNREDQPPSIWLRGDHYEDDQWQYSMGMKLDVADPAGRQIHTVWTIMPTSRGRGNVTQGFLFAEPISWRALPEGHTATGLATSGDERCDGMISRDTQTRWAIQLACNGESGLLQLELETSTPSPPWSSIRLSVNARDSAGSHRGWFQLDRSS